MPKRVLKPPIQKNDDNSAKLDNQTPYNVVREYSNDASFKRTIVNHYNTGDGLEIGKPVLVTFSLIKIDIHSLGRLS